MTKTQTAVDVRNINVPVLLVVSIVAFFVWATSFMMNERYLLHEQFRKETRRIEDKMMSIAEDLRALQRIILKIGDTNTDMKSTIESKEAVLLSVCESLKVSNPSMKCGSSKSAKTRE